MKKYSIIVVALLAILAFTNCKRELPYPLDDVQQGAVVDITKTSGTDVRIEAATVPKLGVSLQIPKIGETPFDKVQLVCVFTDTSGVVSTAVVQDNIQQVPANVSIDFASVLSHLGKSTQLAGEDYTFTTNVVSDGNTSYGYIEALKAYNNKSMVDGWKVDGRAYSVKVSYPVVCGFNIADFAGTAAVVDDGWGEYSVNMVAVDGTTVNMVGMGERLALTIPITFDGENYAMSMPATDMGPEDVGLGSPVNLRIVRSVSDINANIEGEVDACRKSITFSYHLIISDSSAGTYDGFDFGVMRATITLD